MIKGAKSSVCVSPFSCKRDKLTLRGYEYRKEGNDLPIAIVCHGFMANQRTVKHYAKLLAVLGYCAFTFDFSGGCVMMGKSDGRTTDMSVLTEVADLTVAKRKDQIKSLVMYPYAQRVTQLLVGLYMLVYLGLICNENMQIEGFWYYLFTGVFEAATIHYAVGIGLAFLFQDNRAFCKYICPITVFLKPMSYFSLLRIKCDKSKCISCGKCKRVCPMNVDVTDNSRNRENGTECILCFECIRNCPKDVL